MKRAETYCFVIGVMVGSLFTWYAYHAKIDPVTAKLTQAIFLIFFPPSIAYMALDNASKIEQAIGVAFAVGTNGALYLAVCSLFRRLGRQ